jgi:hypothetical protein
MVRTDKWMAALNDQSTEAARYVAAGVRAIAA